MIDSKVLPDLEYAQIQIRTAQNPLGTSWFRLESVRATAVGRDAVLAGDQKGLVYYVMID